MILNKFRDSLSQINGTYYLNSNGPFHLTEHFPKLSVGFLRKYFPEKIIQNKQERPVIDFFNLGIIRVKLSAFKVTLKVIKGSSTVIASSNVFTEYRNLLFCSTMRAASDSLISNSENFSKYNWEIVDSEQNRLSKNPTLS